VTLALRTFRDGDGPALLAVHTAAILATSDDFYTFDERQSWAFDMAPERYGQAHAAGEHFLLAVEGSSVLGFCSWDAAQICGLYVSPDQQARGIGTTLLAQAESALRRSGTAISRIHSSLPAAGFYQRHGYTPTGQSTYPSRGGLLLAVTFLEKQL
jgi:ribosomal protein S18 acetylase RimI-like enzyme